MADLRHLSFREKIIWEMCFDGSKTISKKSSIDRIQLLLFRRDMMLGSVYLYRSLYISI